jgi:hypothetical protein
MTLAKSSPSFKSPHSNMPRKYEHTYGRINNRRFLQMCSHHLIEPVACTPASGWEKGQVENQVGNLRDQMFRPKPRVKSLAELNAWLEDQCRRIGPFPCELMTALSRTGVSMAHRGLAGSRGSKATGNRRLRGPWIVNAANAKIVFRLQGFHVGGGCDKWQQLKAALAAVLSRDLV